MHVVLALIGEGMFVACYRAHSARAWRTNPLWQDVCNRVLVKASSLCRAWARFSSFLMRKQWRGGEAFSLLAKVLGLRRLGASLWAPGKSEAARIRLSARRPPRGLGLFPLVH